MIGLAAAAAVTLALAWTGRALAGRWGALLAPALLWLDPRAVDAVRGWPGRSAAPPLLTLLLSVPAASLVAMAGGLLHGAWRLAHAARGREATLQHEALLLAGAVLPLALAAWPGAGFGAAVAALPFLSLLGARALVAAGTALWPGREAGVTASLALLVLLPGGWAVVHAWPYGFAAWNELAGGAPGAASAGLPRQPGGDAAAGLLASIDAHAVPGARVWWDRTAPAAVERWQRDGRLRADLRPAGGPEEADLAVWTCGARERDREYRIWTAFGTARPVDGVFLDEVPLALLYARAGAWR